MSMTDLERLAEAVEQMTVPCREMDALIHFLTNRKWIGRIPTWPPTKIERPAMEAGLYMHIEGDGYFYGDEVPYYTASIDSAMTLVPEGCRVRGFGEGKSGIWTVDLAGRDAQRHACVAIGSGPTPALALCAAALAAKSREVG